MALIAIFNRQNNAPFLSKDVRALIPRIYEYVIVSSDCSKKNTIDWGLNYLFLTALENGKSEIRMIGFWGELSFKL